MAYNQPSQDQLDRLTHRRTEVEGHLRSLLETRSAQGVSDLDAVDSIKASAMAADLETLDDTITEYRRDLERSQVPERYQNLGKGGAGGAAGYSRQWSQQVAEKLVRTMGRDGESRAIVSGSIDIPGLVEPDVIDIARPARLVDLLVTRRAAPGQAVEYYRQTVRTTLANVVPDGTLKPTSVYTLVPVIDHMRVLAHLCEETPQRLWDDHNNLQSWLQAEMFGGLADALELQVIAGNGVGENFGGVLTVAGTTQVAYATDVATTLRSAVTALQVKGEQPNAWVMNPADAQATDLSRWGTSGGFLSEGYATGVGAGSDPSSNNIFGTVTQRVISNSVPAGTAVLADWSKLALYIRQDANLAIDASGPLFTKNTFIARAEMRCVSAVLRPSAFAIVDLTP